MRLMESSKGKVTMIIRKMRRRSPYPSGTIVYLWETLMVLMVQDPNQASQQLGTEPKMRYLKS
jgi:hypothetical protein